MPDAGCQMSEEESMYETPLGPSLTRGEYWLLESVVEAGIPLCWLAWDSLDEAINKQGHGLARPILLQTLDGLFQAGLLEAFHNLDETPRRLTIEQLDAALDENQTAEQGFFFYLLTERGGAVWEAFAQPRWEQFLQHSVQPSENSLMDTGHVAGMNKKLVERYVQGLHYLKRAPDPASIQWREHRPWQATYWKVLPEAYEISFDFVPDDEEVFSWDELPRSYWWVYENNWYNWK
jgi:hypothetical protein